MPPTALETGTPASIKAKEVAQAVAIEDEPLLIVTLIAFETSGVWGVGREGGGGSY